MDRLSPSHPAPGRSGGRGGAAGGLAMRDGPHALSKVGPRLAERGRLAMLQPGRPRAARQDDRWGHSLEALLAAHRHTGWRALARKARAGYAIPPPWLPQDTTPRALSGASADAPPRARAPRPAYGPSTEGRDDLTQVRLRRGGRGASGRPRRGGVRDGHRRERVATPVA